jgi:hypothetical protein
MFRGIEVLTGDQSIAFRKTRDIAEHDQPAERDVEAEIREFMRRDLAATPGRQQENESELAASNINSAGDCNVGAGDR